MVIVAILIEQETPAELKSVLLASPLMTHSTESSI